MGRKIVGCAPKIVALVAGLSLFAAAILAKPETQSNGTTLEWMQIFVNIADGPTLNLSVETGSSVNDLKRYLTEHEGIDFSCTRSRLEMGNTELSYTKKLSDYNIQAGTTVTLAVIPDQYASEVIVRTRGGQELKIAVRYDESVASLKQTIAQMTGTPQVDQRLLLKGKELKDERKLVHYDIRTDTKLELGGPLADCRQVVPIFVKTLSGATVEVEVDLANTVHDLKEKIWQKAGVPVGVQRLSVESNERVIAGEDHLCDLGLKAGSTVYMYLYSNQITGLHRVARLQEPPVASSVNNRAPIFREAEDESKTVSIYKDARNWVPREGLSIRWQPELFDPIAYLTPNPDDDLSIARYRDQLEIASNLEAKDGYHLQAPMFSARLKLSLALKSYRVAANITSVDHARQSRGITLGGGSIDVSPDPLGADVNNWAPDAFTDADLMRLFEVAERVRQVLATGPKAGEQTLSIARQRQINFAILSTYLDALAGYRPIVGYDHPKEGDECAICREELTHEPAVMLPCKHGFHLDCIVSWQAKLYQARGVTDCHYCRQRFMYPYELYGKAELESPDLQVDRDE